MCEQSEVSRKKGRESYGEIKSRGRLLTAGMVVLFTEK
jgi:hypothetical protein